MQHCVNRVGFAAEDVYYDWVSIGAGFAIEVYNSDRFGEGLEWYTAGVASLQYTQRDMLW